MFDTARKKLQLTSRRKAAGTATHSFSSMLLEGQKLTVDEEFDLKWSAASLYSGAWARPSCNFFFKSYRHNISQALQIRLGPVP
jgi:hypothetical protein